MDKETHWIIYTLYAKDRKRTIIGYLIRQAYLSRQNIYYMADGYGESISDRCNCDISYNIYSESVLKRYGCGLCMLESQIRDSGFNFYWNLPTRVMADSLYQNLLDIYRHVGVLKG